jgi:pimeloyl-ACP methyl ester carboxylesterase
VKPESVRVASDCVYLCAVLAVLWVAPGGARASSEAAALRCRPVEFSVTLSPTNVTPYRVVGELCGRGEVPHSTLQVLLHGATYSHAYWNWPLEPDRYSYVEFITRAGYATLTIDRIGIGASDHPPSDQVTIASNAFVVHQLVQTMRAGRQVDGFGFVRSERVMLVAHSLGSFIATLEAATYADVDGVILSGLLHNLGPGAGEIALTYYPAPFDPRFAGAGLDFGYITTLPGTRGSTYFYYPPTTDPAVVALDEATKETVTVGEFGDTLAALTQSGNIHVPVLEVVGENDTLYCAPPSCSATGALAFEPLFYAPDACLQLNAIPLSSHDLNLHRHAHVWYEIARAWADGHVGADTRSPAHGCP